MIRLFSRFDSIYFFFSFLFYLLIYFFFNFFYKFDLLFYCKKKFNFFTINFFFPLKNLGFNKGNLIIFLSVIWLIFFFNILSIFPFNFSHTAQVSVVLFLSLSFWLSFIFYFILFNVKGFLFHSVPEGSPIYLIFFLFFIELVSNSIRPITLTVRLVANILTGHLLIILLSKLALNSMPIIFFYLLLNTAELFVSIIQAYIFGILIVLFYSEIN